MTEQNNQSQEELALLRAQIRAKDEEILRVVAERLELARKVGEVKLKLQLPIKDERTEQGVLEHARKMAKIYGVYTPLAEQISLLLMRYAVIAQDENHAKASAVAAKLKRKTTIVGGLGRMGLWLADFFADQGHTVTLLDLQTKTIDSEKRAQATSFRVSNDFEAAVSDADIVVLATPISITSSIIASLTNLKPRGLILDICSLKSPLIAEINRARAAGLKIGSAHPMFGPNVEVMAGRNILICDTGDIAVTDQIQNLFSKSTATITRVSLEDHDRLMGQVLGHSHLCSLVFARSLQTSGLTFADLAAVSSTTFAAQLQVTKAVMGENPDLYFEIQYANSYTESVIRGVRQSFIEYEAAIANGDRKDFVKMMKEGHAYLS